MVDPGIVPSVGEKLEPTGEGIGGATFGKVGGGVVDGPVPGELTADGSRGRCTPTPLPVVPDGGVTSDGGEGTLSGCDGIVVWASNGAHQAVATRAPTAKIPEGVYMGFSTLR